MVISDGPLGKGPLGGWDSGLEWVDLDGLAQQTLTDARRAVWDVLRELTRKGSTVLLTTHYLDEAEALSERLYIVEEGRILFEGTAADAKRQIGGTLRVSIENGGPVRDLFRSFGRTVEEGTALSVITGPERIHEIMDIALRNRLSATVGPVTLEEAFLTIVGRSIDEE